MRSLESKLLGRSQTYSSIIIQNSPIGLGMLLPGTAGNHEPEMGGGKKDPGGGT